MFCCIRAYFLWSENTDLHDKTAISGGFTSPAPPGARTPDTLIKRLAFGCQFCLILKGFSGVEENTEVTHAEYLANFCASSKVETTHYNDFQFTFHPLSINNFRVFHLCQVTAKLQD